jgi:hypothetical protein
MLTIVYSIGEVVGAVRGRALDTNDMLAGILGRTSNLRSSQFLADPGICQRRIEAVAQTMKTERRDRSTGDTLALPEKTAAIPSRSMIRWNAMLRPLLQIARRLASRSPFT